MTTPADPNQAVADKWSAFEPDLERTYFGFKPLNPYRIRTAYGDGPHVERYRDNLAWPEDSVIERDLAGRRVETIFSICCGFGHVERHFVKRLGTVTKCVGVDLAPGAIEAATHRAKAAGLGGVIEYRVADLNRYDWAAEAGKYDLVIANGALHHLSNLDEVVPALKSLLRAGGTLYAGEHVGASHQDYPPRQLELINALAYLVPPDMRLRWPRRSRVGFKPLDRVLDVMRGDRHIADPALNPHWSPTKKFAAATLRRLFPGTRTGKIRFGLIHDSQREHLLATDPSEGVRSAEVIPLIRQHFGHVDVRPYGGGLLAYAIDRKFYERYDANNPAHVRLLELLTALEAHYTATGECPIEHAIIVARP